ncbi:hypothetical protein TYRP_003850 [Tyrophagus putrescentiae]|nr:hypothetical protein TYRP_003850 [Tyrophagus putrescentiae]
MAVVSNTRPGVPWDHTITTKRKTNTQSVEIGGTEKKEEEESILTESSLPSSEWLIIVLVLDIVQQQKCRTLLIKSCRAAQRHYSMGKFWCLLKDLREENDKIEALSNDILSSNISSPLSRFQCTFNYATAAAGAAALDADFVILRLMSMLMLLPLLLNFQVFAGYRDKEESEVLVVELSSALAAASRTYTETASYENIMWIFAPKESIDFNRT